MFKLEFYFKKPVRPTRLGEVRWADKKQDFDGQLKEIINVLKKDSDFDNVLYVRAIDDEGTRRVDIYPKSHGFDIYCKKLDDLLKFIDPDFIKNKVKEKTGEMLFGTKAYLLQCNTGGYVFTVEQYAYDGTKWKLYEDAGN